MSAAPTLTTVTPTYRRIPSDLDLATEAGQHAADAINKIGEYLTAHDPDAVLMLDREQVTLGQLLGAGTMAVVGCIPEGLTVFVSHQDARNDLARILRLPILEFIGGAVGGPGGMKVLIRAGRPR